MFTLVLCLVLGACQPAASNIQVTDAWARPANTGDSGANVSAAYMIITNTGSAADQLLGVITDAAHIVQMHRTRIQNGIAFMDRVDHIDIPAQGSVQIAPGGYHLMIMDLQRDLHTGDKIALTLKFASGKSITVEADIREE